MSPVGVYLHTHTPAPLRFLRLVSIGDGCWEWLGSRHGKGYGHFAVRGTTTRMKAHRYSYELFRGPIPEGMTLDHLCRNRSCVNPSHLEPVTNRENILRGEGLAARCARQTHCKYGHPFDEANTVVTKRQRICRTCHRRNGRAGAARRRARARLAAEQT
jgi:hypothetical protein